MTSLYYYGAILAAATLTPSTTLAAEGFAPIEEADRAERELGGWGGGRGHHGRWGKPGNWGPGPASSSSSSSSSGKSGKSGGSKGSKGSSSSSSSHDGHPGGWGGQGGWGGAPPSWHGGYWPATSSSSSSSSGKSGKSGGSSKGSKGSYSSSSSHDGHPGGGGPWGGNGGWHGGWPDKPSSSSSSTSGKSGKSGGSKGSKGSSSSSSISHDGPWSGAGGWNKPPPPAWGDGGHWVWTGPGGPGGWDTDGSWSPSSSSSSSSTSGKSGKSGGSSGSGKSGKGSSSSTSVDSDDDDDDGNWGDDGWNGVAPKEPLPPIYTVGGSVGGWNSDGWDNDGHYKADIDYVRAQVSKLIDDSDRRLIPKFLRLGFHDCVGGCDGCVDLTNADNKGLSEPIEAIYPIVQKFKDSYSRADIWALATLVSADMSVLEDRPHGLHFPMRYFGRKDCDGASPKGVGGSDVTMPSNDFNTHELLDFFKEYFDFDTDETVTIMGVHAVAVAHRKNSGFGNKDKKDGWVVDAESYVLNNRYFGMLVGHDGDKINSAPAWHLELVHNDDGIPSRYQWYHEKDGKDERPIMTNADMALVRDFSDHMHVDASGNEGAVNCLFKDEEKKHGSEGGGTHDQEGLTNQHHMRRRTLNGGGMSVCPVASETIEKMVEYKMDNELFLYDFEKVLEKMVKNGY